MYENGVFRPLAALPHQFQEHQVFTVTMEEIDEDQNWLADANAAVSLDAVRQVLANAPGTLAQLVHAEREDR